MGAANGLASAAMEKAERAGLNKFAFGVARKLYKQDPVKAAHNIRALMLYIDLLGLEAQTDIEDAIKEQDKADERDEREADDRRQIVEEVLANGGQVALEKFRKKIGGAEQPFVEKQLERFVGDWPELADQAEEIALQAQH